MKHARVGTVLWMAYVLAVLIHVQSVVATARNMNIKINVKLVKQGTTGKTASTRVQTVNLGHIVLDLAVYATCAKMRSVELSVINLVIFDVKRVCEM